MKKTTSIITARSYRAIDIRTSISTVKEFGLWWSFWGTDIFINGVPFLKVIVLANIIVWLLFSK